MYAFISSHLDYCIALLFGIPPKKTISHLQLFQNLAAQVLRKNGRQVQVTPVLTLAPHVSQDRF